MSPEDILPFRALENYVQTRLKPALDEIRLSGRQPTEAEVDALIREHVAEEIRAVMSHPDTAEYVVSGLVQDELDRAVDYGYVVRCPDGGYLISASMCERLTGVVIARACRDIAAAAETGGASCE